MRFSKDRLGSPYRQNLYIENEELYASLLKGHLLDKRKFKKNMKSIRREVQPEQPTFEGKGKKPMANALKNFV